MVLAAIWTLAGWSMPGILAQNLDLIPPPGGQYWVANQQPIELVVEVIKDDAEKQERFQELPLRVEIVDPQSESVATGAVARFTESVVPAEPPHFRVRPENRPSRSAVTDPSVSQTIRRQPLARVESTSSSNDPLPEVHDVVEINRRPLRELPQTELAQKIPQQSVAGGSIRTPGVVRQPLVRPVYNPSPKYPEQALAQQQQGLVKIRVRVDTDGTVLMTRVVQTSNNRSLDAAALKAVSQWRFTVSFQQSVKQPVEVIVPIRFRIELP